VWAGTEPAFVGTLEAGSRRASCDAASTPESSIYLGLVTVQTPVTGGGSNYAITELEEQILEYFGPK